MTVETWNEAAPMRPLIRLASLHDLPDLVRLNLVVQELHAALDPTVFRASTSDEEVSLFFAARLETTKDFFLLAEKECRSIGYVWFELQEKPATPFTVARKRIYVHHIVVEQEFRRYGVASALLARVEREALSSLHVRSILLDTWALNEEAHHFFKAHGLHAINFVFEKRL